MEYEIVGIVFGSFVLTGILMVVLHVKGGILSFVIWIFSIVILYRIYFLIEKKKEKKVKNRIAKSVKEEIDTKNKEIEKYNEEVKTFNETVYAEYEKKKKYTDEKINELIALYEPILNKEIEDSAAKDWEFKKQDIKNKIDKFLLVEEEYKELELEFNSIDDETANKLAELITTHRVETLKDAFDVLEQREHNSKMERIAREKAIKEEEERQEREEARRRLEREYRLNQQREEDRRKREEISKWSEERDRKQAFDRAQKQYDNANRALNGMKSIKVFSDNVYRQQRDEALAEMLKNK